MESWDFKLCRRFYRHSARLFIFILTFLQSHRKKKQLKSENVPEHRSVWFCYALVLGGKKGPIWLNLQSFDAGLLLCYFREDGPKLSPFFDKCEATSLWMFRQWRTALVGLCRWHLNRLQCQTPAFIFLFFLHKIFSIKLTSGVINISDEVPWRPPTSEFWLLFWERLQLKGRSTLSSSSPRENNS